MPATKTGEWGQVSIAQNGVMLSWPTYTLVGLGATNYAYVGQKGFHSIGMRADINLDFLDFNLTVHQTGHTCTTTGPFPWYNHHSFRGNQKNYHYGKQENHYVSGGIENIYYLDGVGGMACAVNNYYKRPAEAPEAEVKLMTEVEGEVQVECEYYDVKAVNAAGAYSEYVLSPDFGLLGCTDEKGVGSSFFINSKEIESEAKTIFIKSSDGPSIEVSSTGILLKFNDSTYIKLSDAGVEIKGSIINLNN